MYKLSTRPICNHSTPCAKTYKPHVTVIHHPCKQNLKRNSRHSCVMTRELRERFWKFFWTFYCVIFPGISCSETREIHIFILFVEFLVICTSKTREIHITIEHVTRKVHYSPESPMSILCTQLVLFPRNTHITNLCHS